MHPYLVGKRADPATVAGRCIAHHGSSKRAGVAKKAEIGEEYTIFMDYDFLRLLLVSIGKGKHFSASKLSRHICRRMPECLLDLEGCRQRRVTYPRGVPPSRERSGSFGVCPVAFPHTS